MDTKNYAVNLTNAIANSVNEVKNVLSLKLDDVTNNIMSLNDADKCSVLLEIINNYVEKLKGNIDVKSNEYLDLNKNVDEITDYILHNYDNDALIEETDDVVKEILYDINNSQFNIELPINLDYYLKRHEYKDNQDKEYCDILLLIAIRLITTYELSK